MLGKKKPFLLTNEGIFLTGIAVGVLVAATVLFADDVRKGTYREDAPPTNTIIAPSEEGAFIWGLGDEPTPQ